MKIIDNIKDFHKIKVGYTVSLDVTGIEIRLKEIGGVDYESLSIELTDVRDLGGDRTILDLFEAQDIKDVVFPCSIEDVPKYFPEYFI